MSYLHSPFLLLPSLLLLYACAADGSAQSSQLSLSATVWMPDVTRMTPVPTYWPLPRTEERPTPLYFGLYVTPNPDDNPIDPPERFTGFHVATDYEILPGEEESDVPVFAICDGLVMYSGYAEGYGGLLVQECTIQKEEVTILYGHLQIDPLPPRGSTVIAGQQLSLLADARTYESGENRKHLHLGIHRGPQLDMRGYVQKEHDLRQYIDPQSVLPLRE